MNTFVTFGCRLNTYETEAMKELVAQTELENTVVVNTCAVTAEAVRQARQNIRRLRRENPEVSIIVTGCAAQTEPETFADMPEVSLVLGNTEKMQSKTWHTLSKREIEQGPDFIGPTEKILVNDIMETRLTSGHLIDGFGTRARAYVQIQNGCDHRCTFCIIPYGRGNSRSVPAGTIIEQIKRLVSTGYNEVVLTGVDLTSWGSDLPGTPHLGDIVQKILMLVPDLQRLRISSIDSIETDPALLEAIYSEKRLMPHLHLSLQAGDNMTLKRMKRRHNREDATLFCQNVKKHRPEMVFGADLIAGFPTETEEMFLNTLALVDECDLTYLHVFPFSPRKGTPAAKMPQVNRQVVKQRAARLRTVAQDKLCTYLKQQVGRTHRVLLEKNDVGRTETFAEVRLQQPVTRDAQVGNIVECVILSSNEKNLFGHIVE